jgi:DNA-binding IclR family transcriptional regulator
MLKTIRYAGAVLDLFTAERPSWRHTQIAEAVGLPKSSTHELVSSLVEAGLLASPSRGLYEINWQVLQFASLFGREDDLVISGAQILSRLSNSEDVSAQLVVLRRWLVHCVFSQQHQSVLQLALPSAGDSFTAHTSAAGKALLAVRPYAEVRQFVDVVAAPPGTGEHRVDWRALEMELVEVRKHGFSIDQGSYVDGVCCVAAPVHTQVSAGVAAVVAVVPVCRFERARSDLEQAIIAAAHELSDVLESRR